MLMRRNSRLAGQPPVASWPVVITFEAGGGGGSAAVFQAE
jgi:hypothetical protein